MNILTITSRTITVEIENDLSYYNFESVSVKLDGVEVLNTDKNVFTLFDLEPNREYCLQVGAEKSNFKTDNESFVLNVRDFGALGDGVHDDTSAFTAAIAVAPKGATLYVGSGTYFLKPLFLKSDLTVYLSKDATLLGNPDRLNYPILPALICGDGEMNLGTWQGEEADCFASLLTGYNVENVKIIGNGIVDCNALAGDWYKNHREKRIAWRPRGVFLNNCKNVLLQGITVKDTPSWNIHPYFCKGVKLLDLKLLNTPSMPTTDGVDPDTCDGVEMIGLDISVGDDCIAIKSCTLEAAKKYRLPCKNIVIRNCLMRAGHGGVVFGSELSGGIENVEVTKCLFDGTDRGLRIKTRRGRGRIGICNNVSFKNIVMKNVAVPFVINSFYNMGDNTGHTEYVWTTEKLPVDERTPKLSKFAFEDIVCTGVEFSAGSFFGLPESPIDSVKLKNVVFSYNENAEFGFTDMMEKNQQVCRQGLDFRYVKSVELENVKFEKVSGDEVLLTGVEDCRRN